MDEIHRLVETIEERIYNEFPMIDLEEYSEDVKRNIREARENYANRLTVCKVLLEEIQKTDPSTEIKALGK